MSAEGYNYFSSTTTNNAALAPTMSQPYPRNWRGLLLRVSDLLRNLAGVS